jgi:hypothetical protein
MSSLAGHAINEWRAIPGAQPGRSRMKEVDMTRKQKRGFAEATRKRWTRRRFGAAALALLLPPPGASAEDTVFETFDDSPETRWEFFADTVMGGVSTGQVSFLKEGGVAFARMTGQVSTANRGGFIQFRRKLSRELDARTEGVRLVARGNDQRYFVHLRTKGTMLPWQYFQSAFDVRRDWREFRLPLTSFAASGGLMRASPPAASVTSVGIVAYGRDHEARIDVREIGFF